MLAGLGRLKARGFYKEMKPEIFAYLVVPAQWKMNVKEYKNEKKEFSSCVRCIMFGGIQCFRGGMHQGV